MLEVLIAATVLMVGLAGMSVAKVAARDLARTSEETQAATTALAEAIEALKLTEPEELVEAFPPGVALTELPESSLRNLTIVPTYPGHEDGDAVVPTRVTATWDTFDGGSRSIHVTTAI